MEHNVTGKQHNSKMCFVCGLKNSAGLKASFYETDATLVALFTPGVEHQSYPGRLHGGIASAILDETIGRAINAGCRGEEIWGVTLELTMTYRKPIPLGQELRVIGRVTEEKSRYYLGTGEILLPDGEVAVSAVGKYLKAPLEKIADFDAEENEWKVVRRGDDPKYITF